MLRESTAHVVLRRSLIGLRAAVAFLTRVPVPGRPVGRDDLAGAVPWFPVVGAAVGAALGAAYAGLLAVVPPVVAAAVTVVGGVAVTGAFHEDGLADVADAMGGWSREQRLAILDDPRHGTYGVLALVASVVVRVAGLAALGGAAGVAALVAAHAVGRAAAVVLLVTTPPARVEGLGVDHATGLRSRPALAGAAAGLASAGLLGWPGLAALALVAAAAIALRRWAVRALGGVSGDVLGACEQAGEALVIVVAAAGGGPWA